MRSIDHPGIGATVGFATVLVGAWLPWAHIGGRNRSGFSTADTFVALGQGALPNAVAWVGRWWYLPVIAALVTWSLVVAAVAGGLPRSAASRRWIRRLGLGLTAVGAAMWWVFVWAGANWDIFDVRLVGPTVASVGLAVLGWSSRGSAVTHFG